MIYVIGEQSIPEAKAFDRVRESLDLDCDVYLGAMWSKFCNEPIPDGSVIYNMEPLSDYCRSFTLGYFDILKKNIVLDYCKNNVKYLKLKGIEAFHLPYGYHQSLEKVKPQNKTIDVMLIGSVNPRRLKIVNELRKKFDVVWVTGAYGDQLDTLVGMSKVQLNLHYSDEHPLEVVRLNYLMANHCTVVSERSYDKNVDDKYENGIYFAEDIEKMCLYALSNPLDGYNCIKSMPMDCHEANEWIRSRLCLG